MVSDSSKSKYTFAIKDPLLDAEFLERPNRFLVKFKLGNTEEWGHLPDPGRLKELLFPGAKLLVRRASSPTRKTKFSVAMVYSGEQLISINSMLPNQVVLDSLRKNCLPGFEEYKLIKPEFTIGKHRYDFLLEKGGKKALLEVKSVTLIEEGIARFPDAVTERGRSHVQHLVELQKDEYEAGVLFIVQRNDATLFQPHWVRDPKFSETLYRAEQSGLKINILSLNISKTAISWNKELPYDVKDYR